MASSQRYGSHSGRGGSIAVAAIATVGGVAALFAYHTSPGHAGTTDAANAMPAGNSTAMTGAATGGTGMAAGGQMDQQAQGGQQGKAGKTAGTSGAKTYLGQPAQTRWGTVQVKISVKNGKITNAQAVQHPHSSQHSIDINQYAVPVLNKEAVKAGNAKIDSVSGATVTSGGYQQSLQSAVDMAHL